MLRYLQSKIYTIKFTALFVTANEISRPHWISLFLFTVLHIDECFCSCVLSKLCLLFYSVIAFCLFYFNVVLRKIIFIVRYELFLSNFLIFLINKKCMNVEGILFFNIEISNIYKTSRFFFLLLKYVYYCLSSQSWSRDNIYCGIWPAVRLKWQVHWQRVHYSAAYTSGATCWALCTHQVQRVGRCLHVRCNLSALLTR